MHAQRARLDAEDVLDEEAGAHEGGARHAEEQGDVRGGSEQARDGVHGSVFRIDVGAARGLDRESVRACGGVACPGLGRARAQSDNRHYSAAQHAPGSAKGMASSTALEAGQPAGDRTLPPGSCPRVSHAPGPPGAPGGAACATRGVAASRWRAAPARPARRRCRPGCRSARASTRNRRRSLRPAPSSGRGPCSSPTPRTSA